MSSRRRQLVKAFKAAKLRLRPTSYATAERRRQPTLNTFICHALDDAQMNGFITYLQMQMAVKVIESRLGPERDSVEDFLVSTIGRSAFLDALRQDPDCVQKYRHRWVDALIAEFSK